MSGQLFRLNRTMVALVAIFVLLFLLFAARDAFAGDSEFSFQGGYAALRGETPAIGLNLRWPEAAPGGMDWEAGLLLSGTSAYKDRDNSNVATVYGMLVPNWGPFEMGLGLAYHSSGEVWNYTCAETFALMLGMRVQRVTLRWMHFSSGGTCKPNVGRDFPLVGLTFGWRF